MEITFNINGTIVTLDISAKKRLLDILRDDLNLTGTKEGCGKGECGACTVLMDGRRVNSCLVPALQLHGSRIVTVEGLQQWPAFRAIEQAFIQNGAVQCGFCTPGFVMTTFGVVIEANALAAEPLSWRIGGNICRCTGYTKIIAAVQDILTRSDLVQQIQEDFAHAFQHEQ